MKSLFLVLFTLMSLPAFAAPHPSCSVTEPDCMDNQELWNRKCTAKDSQGKSYTYYMSIHFHVSTNKKLALKKCKTESSNPGSCKVVSCVEY